MVVVFLFTGCNARPLPSLLWGSPSLSFLSLWVPVSATTGLTRDLIPREEAGEEAEGALFFSFLPAFWRALVTEGRIKLPRTGSGTGLGPPPSRPLLSSEKDDAQVSSPCHFLPSLG